MRRMAVGLVASVTLLTACSGEGPRSGPAGPSVQPTASAAPSAPSSTPTPTDSGRRPLHPGAFDAGRAMAVVRHLAGELGPRHGTSPVFAQAADWVAGRFDRHGYRVERQRFDVPAGTSWGIPVDAGTSVNVIAIPRGFDPTRPHLVVGAHLDTVPQAPGAEDNASGVGVLLAAAGAAAEAETRLPVVWVAFGAEEPRGPSDDDHHYGSRAYVARMSGPERRALRGMVSLDRVGVGETVPVGSPHESDPVQRSLLAAARRADVPTTPDPQQRSSDHWSFVRDGLPGARLGSTPYAAYHSAQDLPGVVQADQLRRTGRLLLSWLAPSA